MPFYSVSECSSRSYSDCLAGKPRCQKGYNSSSVMSFCAPLSGVTAMGWGGAESFTVLRHPVDRVWSMYRFRTSSCYRCRPLLEIYERLDNGTLDEVCGAGTGGCTGICVPQLQDHLTQSSRRPSPPPGRSFDFGANI